MKSSGLDLFRRGGDSLLGRYHYYRLHPFSLHETAGYGARTLSFPKDKPKLAFDETGDHLKTLLTFGGFPEPYLAASERVLKRWQKERFERVFREDIRETDSHGIKTELYYVRDLEKREVDFLVVWENDPWFLVECNLSPPKRLIHLNYFADRLGVDQRYCVTLSDKRDYQDKRTGVRVIPAGKFLMALI